MIAIDAFWPALLELREQMCGGESARVGWESWHFDCDRDGIWQFSGTREATDWSYSEAAIRCDLSTPIPDALCRGLGLTGRYLDCLWRQQASNRRKPLTTASFAQTLDGFIATTDGDSQWIGNEDNQVHAHRLRALHDGILVGSRTITQDAPQLTVRKVSGCHPLRVVITRRREPSPSMLSQINHPTLLVKPPAKGDQQLCRRAPVQVCPVDAVLDDDYLCLAAVLDALWQRGIRSLMIEGGGVTLSRFHRSGLLDAADIQVAPMLLGDGVRPLATEPSASIAATTVHSAQSICSGSQVLLAVRFASRECQGV